MWINPADALFILNFFPDLFVIQNIEKKPFYSRFLLPKQGETEKRRYYSCSTERNVGTFAWYIAWLTQFTTIAPWWGNEGMSDIGLGG